MYRSKSLSLVIIQIHINHELFWWHLHVLHRPVARVFKILNNDRGLLLWLSVHELVFKKPLNSDLAAPLGQQSIIYIKLKEIVCRFRKGPVKLIKLVKIAQ